MKIHKNTLKIYAINKRSNIYFTHDLFFQSFYKSKVIDEYNTHVPSFSCFHDNETKPTITKQEIMSK